MKRILIISGLLLGTLKAIRLSIHEAAESETFDDDETQKNFVKYMGKFHRKYSNSTEYKQRMKMFGKNKSKIDKFNKANADKAGF